MAKIKCSEYEKGVKTCEVMSGSDKGRVFHARKVATSATKAKRRSWGKRLKAFRFKKSDVRGCPKKNRKAFGKCVARKMLARIRK